MIRKWNLRTPGREDDDEEYLGRGGHERLSMLISAARVVTPARVFAPGWVLVDGDRIADVGPGEPPREPDVDLPGATVVPGFVDAHVHGGGGAAFDAGGPEAAADRRRRPPRGTAPRR